MPHSEMRGVSVVCFVFAGGALLFAAYLYSFCVPLEAGCHLGTTGSCERLAATLGASAKAAVVAGCCLVGGLLLRCARKR